MTTGGLAERRSPRLLVRPFAGAALASLAIGALVLGSAAVRLRLAWDHPGPWIFIDELVYSELARSFAAGGSFAVRDVAGLFGFGPVYPVLVSPAYAAFDSLPTAYAAAKGINAFVMSLAAVPTYLLARRLLRPGLSLLAALFAVALPHLLYTGAIMTENVFYPVFLAAVLALTSALERPTAARQLAALASIALATATRAQGAALLPALVTAIVALAFLTAPPGGARTRARYFLREIAAYRVTWLSLAAGAVLLVAVQLARGGSPLGPVVAGYAWATAQGPPVTELARWLLYLVADLDLLVGVLPFAAFLVFVALALSGRDRHERVFAVALVSVVFWLLVVVAAFVAQLVLLTGEVRLHERYVFYLGPLLFIALLALVERGFRRPRRIALPAAAVAYALPATLPYDRLMNSATVSDSFTLLLLQALTEEGIARAVVPGVVLLFALVATVFFLVAPRRLALVGPALVLVYLGAVNVVAEPRIDRTSSLTLAATRSERDWIDDEVRAPRVVVVVWDGTVPPSAVWGNEFFNRSLGRVFYLDAPFPVTLPQSPLTVDPRSGALIDHRGRPLRADYVLSSTSLPISGTLVRRNRLADLGLYRTAGATTVSHRISGLYPDTWSGPQVRYTRFGCRGGYLVVALYSDPAFFERPQTVSASSGGRRVASVSVPPGEPRRFEVPLRGEQGVCEARLSVSPTVVPADVLGTGDTRRLGIHVVGFDYRPANR